MSQPRFRVPEEDRTRLEDLPWGKPLVEWAEQGVQLLSIRRGDSRHPVVFVERDEVRYALKETSPHMAERELRNLEEIKRRGIPTLHPIGTIVVSGQMIALESTTITGGVQHYLRDSRNINYPGWLALDTQCPRTIFPE
jgi:hypothetical protein